MDAKVKEEWIAALESGEYKQTQAYLHRVFEGEDRFCCLGILCELAAKNGIVTRDFHEDALEPHYSYNLNDGTLPDAVQEWAGIETKTARYEDGSLTDDNDVRGHDFAMIARTIRKHF